MGQIAGGIVGFLSICAMVWQAMRPKREELSPTRSVIETVSMADEKPWVDSLQHLEAYLRRTADNSDAIVAMIRKRLEEEERRQIKAEARIEAQEEESRKRMNENLALIAERDRRRREDGQG